MPLLMKRLLSREMNSLTSTQQILTNGQRLISLHTTAFQNITKIIYGITDH